MKDKKPKSKANSNTKKSVTTRKRAKAGKSEAEASSRATKPTKTRAKKAVQSKHKGQVVYLKEPRKSTVNTHDLMHAPVEKTIKMLEKIISGEQLFTM